MIKRKTIAVVENQKDDNVSIMLWNVPRRIEPCKLSWLGLFCSAFCLLCLF